MEIFAILFKMIIPSLALFLYLGISKEMNRELQKQSPKIGLALVIVGYSIPIFTLLSTMILGYSYELIIGSILSISIVPAAFLSYYIFNHKKVNLSIYHSNIFFTMRIYLTITLVIYLLIAFFKFFL